MLRRTLFVRPTCRIRNAPLIIARDEELLSTNEHDEVELMRTKLIRLYVSPIFNFFPKFVERKSNFNHSPCVKSKNWCCVDLLTLQSIQPIVFIYLTDVKAQNIIIIIVFKSGITFCELSSAKPYSDSAFPVPFGHFDCLSDAKPSRPWLFAISNCLSTIRISGSCRDFADKFLKQRLISEIIQCWKELNIARRHRKRWYNCWSV